MIREGVGLTKQDNTVQDDGMSELRDKVKIEIHNSNMNLHDLSGELINLVLDEAIAAIGSVELQYWKSSTIPAVDLNQAIKALTALKTN